MSQYYTVPLSQLPPGTELGALDIFPSTDVSDLTESPSGTTYKYTLEQIQMYLQSSFGGDNLFSVLVATTTNLIATYNNGVAGVGATLTNSGSLTALVIDGVTLAVGARVLIKDQSTTPDNGIYTVKNTGSGTVAWVLTRSTDFDGSNPLEIQQGNFVVVIEGTVNALTTWIETGAGPFIVGTTPIIFTEQLVNTGITGAENLGSGEDIFAGVVGNDLTFKSLVAGNGIILTPNSTEVQISAVSGGITWITVMGTTQLAIDGFGYVIGNSALTTVTLPAAMSVGATIKIMGLGAAGWVVRANTGQIIQFAGVACSSGGAWSTTNANDNATFICTVANTNWAMTSGNTFTPT